MIDGSTSKTPLRVNPAMTNGRYCMEIVRGHIAAMPADTSVEGFCHGVTERIRAVYADRGIDPKRLEAHPEERLTASAVVYSARFNQVWLVGDCQCLIDGTLHDNPKPQEDTLATRRAEFLSEAIAKGSLTVEDVINGTDPGRELIMPYLIESCRQQNRSFAVIDGFDIPMCHVKVVQVPDDAREIVLASDGYPLLRPTLRESEAALHALLAKDPLCISLFKATKGLRRGNSSFDDRSFIRLSRSKN